jgi:hypothetical protein
MRRAGARHTVLVAAPTGAIFVLSVVAACSSSPTPPSGDRLVVDTHPTSTTTSPPPPPPPPPAASYDDAPTYPDVYQIGAPDGYAPLAACKQCACAGTPDAAPPPVPSYCFGGGTNLTFNGTCGQGDGTTLVVGCNPIPAACAAKPTCACILAALPPSLGCYPVCAGTAPDFEVYCPNP